MSVQGNDTEFANQVSDYVSLSLRIENLAMQARSSELNGIHKNNEDLLIAAIERNATIEKLSTVAEKEGISHHAIDNALAVEEQKQRTSWALRAKQREAAAVGTPHK